MGKLLTTSNTSFFVNTNTVGRGLHKKDAFAVFIFELPGLVSSVPYTQMQGPFLFTYPLTWELAPETTVVAEECQQYLERRLWLPMAFQEGHQCH